MQNETLTKENAWRDAFKKAKDGDVSERNRLIEENVGLVYMVLKRFGGRGYDMEELFQVGSIGLLKAVERFDADRELAFSTYAVPLIIGEIRRFLRDDGMLHISRQIKENARKIAIVREQWKKSENREPTIEEIEKELGIDREAVIMAIGSTSAVESIYQPIAGETGANFGGELTVEEQLADKKNDQEEVLNRLAVQQLMEELDEQARNLIRLRYLQGMTQMQAAKCLGINQVAVSRLEKKILLQLRKKF